MNRLTITKRVAVVSALVEGCSVRATVRMTGVAKNTVAKLLIDLGAACTKYQGVKPIPSWNSPRLLMAYAAFFFDVVVSISSALASMRHEA